LNFVLARSVCSYLNLVMLRTINGLHSQPLLPPGSESWAQSDTSGNDSSQNLGYLTYNRSRVPKPLETKEKISTYVERDTTFIITGQEGQKMSCSEGFYFIPPCPYDKDRLAKS
jgi:hypothetical protein